MLLFNKIGYLHSIRFEVCVIESNLKTERITMTPIKVVIADDHTLFREGLRKILSLEKDILVVGEAANGEEAGKLVERLKPDVLLMDLKMPKSDLVQSLLEMSATAP